MDDRGQVDSVYTDFSKAFDKLNHTILIEKLSLVGVHGDLLRWLVSYITNRSQIISIGGYTSVPFTLPSGIAQGTHLGPLLFNIFVSDVETCFFSSKYLMYADDLKIFATIRSPDDCKALQTDLDNFSRYCKKNKLTLNLKKMLFHHLH